ncbi:MAG: hypothetical protein EHM34_05725 [Nitrosopumilales archaeon]|nr:MAG: hypothetical protein EHM34_05725 [Nitrosopumilales archaeon]
MKIREGFVSNSSSTSFIVIGKTGNLNKVTSNDDKIYVDHDTGYKFDWDHTITDDPKGLIAFAWMQAQYQKKPEWVEMIKEVVFETTGCELICSIDITRDGYISCIDHQSAEEDKMFKSKDILKSFIFDKDSYVEMSNDNLEE